MVSELSILIPVYNYNVISLVKSLYRQCQALSIIYEIRLYDDGSAVDILEQNTTGLPDVPHILYKKLTKHLGRAAIRNKLAQDALYPFVLFLDNDCEIVNDNFIRNYLQEFYGEEVLVGGTSYSQKLPPAAYRLHWKYGRQREQLSATQRNNRPYNSFHFNNILLPKAIMQQFPLQELQYGYGHEDTLFGNNLRQARLTVKHINNPVVHTGLEKTTVYLQKTKEAALNLHYLYRNKLVGSEIKLIWLYSFLRKTGFINLYKIFYKLSEKLILKQLHSTNPNVMLLDLYKLYYLTSAETKN